MIPKTFSSWIWNKMNLFQTADIIVVELEVACYEPNAGGLNFFFTHCAMVTNSL